MKQTVALAAACGALAFALYLVSLPPTYAFWDTGELQTVATILGIAHPPACPAFVLLGWAFAHLVPIGEAAWRVNLMCALAVALSVALLYGTARSFAVAPALAAVVALGFATAAVTWKDATRAEVQDLALLLRLLALVAALAYARRGRARDLFAAALALGLAGATHGTALLVIPALALLVWSRRATFGLRAVGLVVLGVALGLLPYAYLPLRSAWLYAHAVDPTLALGLPPGAAFWDYDHPATWPNFVRVVTGADFDVHSGFAGFLAFGAYPQYAAALFARLTGAYGFIGAVLAVLGAGVALWSRDLERIAFVVAALAIVPYTEAYSELQDPDRYYLIALWCGALAIAFAVETVVRLMPPVRRPIAHLALPAALVVAFASNSPARLDLFAQRDDVGARIYTREVAGLVPDGSIVVADWAYSTPLAYASYAERSFGKRIVIAASAAQYAYYYPRWLAHRKLYAISFDDALKVRGFSVVPLHTQWFNLYRIRALGARS